MDFLLKDYSFVVLYFLRSKIDLDVYIKYIIINANNIILIHAPILDPIYFLPAIDN